MTYLSVISHRARSKYRTLREDYVNLCENAPDPVCAAMILDLFESWTNHILDKSEIDEDLDFSGGWFYRSEEGMKRDLFGMYGINKIRDNRTFLHEQKLVFVQQKQRDQGGYMNYYRINVERVQILLNDRIPAELNFSNQAHVENNVCFEADHTLEITGAYVENNDKDIEVKEEDKEQVACATDSGLSAQSTIEQLRRDKRRAMAEAALLRNSQEIKSGKSDESKIEIIDYVQKKNPGSPLTKQSKQILCKAKQFFSEDESKTIGKAPSELFASHPKFEEYIDSVEKSVRLFNNGALPMDRFVQMIANYVRTTKGAEGWYAWLKKPENHVTAVEQTTPRNMTEEELKLIEPLEPRVTFDDEEL